MLEYSHQLQRTEMKLQALTQEQFGDESNGTHLVGEITTTRSHIESVFGEPTFIGGEEDKVTVEWVIVFPNGTVATIYDWKRYEEGTPNLDEEYAWHIGGKNYGAEELVQEYLN